MAAHIVQTGIERHSACGFGSLLTFIGVFYIGWWADAHCLWTLASVPWVWDPGKEYEGPCIGWSPVRTIGSCRDVTK